MQTVHQGIVAAGRNASYCMSKAHSSIVACNYSRMYPTSSTTVNKYPFIIVLQRPVQLLKPNAKDPEASM